MVNMPKEVDDDDVRLVVVSPAFPDGYRGARRTTLSGRLLASYRASHETCFPGADPSFGIRPMNALRSLWETFVLTDAAGRVVRASCIVLFDKVYRTAEVHSVCVDASMRGRGLCGRLMAEVIAYVERHRRDDVRELRVLCEQENVRACACYSRMFPDYRSSMGGDTVGAFRAFAKSFFLVEEPGRQAAARPGVSGAPTT